MKSDRMWFYPPEPPGFVGGGLPTPQLFFRSRVFVWRPVGAWRFSLKCPRGENCVGSGRNVHLSKSGYHSKVRLICDVSGWYTEVLSCGPCTKAARSKEGVSVGRWLAWDNAILSQLSEAHQAIFPAVLTAMCVFHILYKTILYINMLYNNSIILNAFQAVKKLSGQGRGSTEWFTSIGNECSQIVSFVLTCEESAQKLLPMCRGVMDRFRLANQPVPKILYIDRGCCRAMGPTAVETMFQEWFDGGMVVRLDMFHWIHRFDVYPGRLLAPRACWTSHTACHKYCRQTTRALPFPWPHPAACQSANPSSMPATQAGLGASAPPTMTMPTECSPASWARSTLYKRKATDEPSGVGAKVSRVQKLPSCTCCGQPTQGHNKYRRKVFCPVKMMSSSKGLEENTVYNSYKHFTAVVDALEQ
ncbi:hypothetical protein KUCAC02_029693 [Chaenocephalus aceratus]|nr:hypothetical protein KUCAC02_029693 [Chaenocephalus aceratus]